MGAMLPFKENPYMYEVAGPEPATGAKPARGPEYGNVAARDAWPTVTGDPSSLHEMFQNSVAKFGGNPCLGRRPISSEGEAGPYEWLTYAEVGERVSAIGSGLMALGHKAHGRIGVYGINAPEWMMAMQACNRQSAYCVPLYDTLGPDAVKYIIGHAAVSLVFADAAKMRALVEPLKATKGQVQALIYWGAVDASAKEEIAAQAGVRVLSWDEMLALGRGALAGAIPPKPEDLCTIMYTSGTTGNPKGVMLSHCNVLTVVAGQLAATNQIAAGYGETFSADDVMISYLPLAHIFDRVLEEMFLANGARIGYWRGSIEGVIDDLQALKPTLFIGVPRVFDKVYDGVQARLKQAPLRKRLIFALALWYKWRNIKAGYRWDEASPLADKMVFSQVKSKLGGNVRLVCSGSAPLARHVEEFLKTAMCAPVVQGYGLTETCSSSFIALPEPSFTGTVGAPLPLLTFRLEAVPDMGYDPLADPPRGEVIIKGPVVFQGYYKDEEKTAEVLDKDGWFHTGDIGEIDPVGSLRIIDRKKALFKLAQGEYIAPERIEGTLTKTSLVQQIFVHGNPFESSVVAVVVPNQAELTAAVGSGNEQSAEAEEAILAALSAVAREAGLKPFEVPRAVHLSEELWTPENGMLTPTFKLKRDLLRRRFQKDLDALYARMAQAQAKKGGAAAGGSRIDVLSSAK